MPYIPTHVVMDRRRGAIQRQANQVHTFSNHRLVRCRLPQRTPMRIEMNAQAKPVSQAYGFWDERILKWITSAQSDRKETKFCNT